MIFSLRTTSTINRSYTFNYGYLHTASMPHISELEMKKLKTHQLATICKLAIDLKNVLAQTQFIFHISAINSILV